MRQRLLASRARILFVVCLAAAGYFAYTAITGFFETERLREEQAQASHLLAELEWKKEYLEAVKRYVASDAYVEQEARRTLGYVRDGEQAFVVESPALPEDDQGGGEEWWQRLFPR